MAFSVSEVNTGRKKKKPRKKIPIEDSSRPYISPRELTERWRCARSSVDRIADRAGLTKLLLGEGKNGMVRFIRKEVEAYESSRRM